MFEKYRKASTPMALLAGSFLVAVAPAGFATAQPESSGDGSPYLIGHWKLNDRFKDFKHGSPIFTDNTEFVFLNPTNLKLTLEYAFFAADPKTEGTVFCGCDIDSLNPNGRVRYTMLGEVEGGKFSRTLCPTQTDGTMKTIVFPGKEPTNPPGDEVQAGYQIDLSRGNERTESGLLAVPINGSTFADEQDVHKACIGFPGAKPKKIP